MDSQSGSLRMQTSKRMVNIRADTLTKRSLALILAVAMLLLISVYFATAFLLPNVFVSPSSIEECPEGNIDFRGNGLNRILQQNLFE
jgi:hypothetical protein